jgi:adenylylsulfate kinase-like enzyme
MTDAGLIVLTAFISPFRADRARVRAAMAPGDFLEVHVATSLDECERRDPKGLYAKARRGELRDMTGIDSPYEPPELPDLVVGIGAAPAEDHARSIVALLEDREIIPRR